MSAQRVAVVSGGNKGIGFAIVRALCKKFSGIVYLTARDLGRGTEAVKSLEKEGLKPKFHLLDVSDQQSINILRDYMVKNYGGVDVFVHNAGIAYKVSSTAPFGEQAEVTVTVNTLGTINVCNTFLPVMKENGRFVNLSSGTTNSAMRDCSKENQEYFRSPDLTEEKLIEKLNEFIASAKAGKHEQKGFAKTAYGMSKVGVTAFTRLAAKKAECLDKKNILVNCCCPGWVKTDMAGERAPLTPDQGAVTPVNLALIPESDKEPNGQFVRDGKIINW